MLIRTNIKAVSTLTLILLMIISAITGGFLSYMFTIAFFTKIPEKTTIAITGVYFNKENARSFKISVLNPSYSPTDATVTRIAVSLKGESQLYDIVETDPSIENGTVIPRGESLNITCYRVRRDSASVSWGRLANDFAGKIATVHVFSPESPAANMQVSVPFVSLRIADTDFDSEVSFNRFNITIENDADSEINLTISDIMAVGVDWAADGLSPVLPQPIATNASVHFTCSGSWHNLVETTLTISTEEGYVYSQELELPGVSIIVQNVTFNENYTDHFNVTVFNLADSANHVNVTKILCTQENGTIIERDYPSVGVAPNSTKAFKFDWSWKEYRGKEINVTTCLLQDFQTDAFTVTTLPPIIIDVLNEKRVFDLKDKEHFNITLRNHPSSIKPVNITKMVIKETGEVINGTDAYPELPYGPVGCGQERTFYCNLTDWTDRTGKNLTLTVHAIDETSGNHTLEFMFTLPVAELNITAVTHTAIGETKYLNITVENLDYSLRNVTLLKVIIMPPNQSEPLEQLFPRSQIIVKVGEKVVLFLAFNWEEHLGDSITITVVTEEEVEASWQGTSW